VRDRRSHQGRLTRSDLRARADSGHEGDRLALASATSAPQVTLRSETEACCQRAGDRSDPDAGACSGE
jgi:hypothetical protein